MSIFVKFVDARGVFAQYEITHALTEPALLPEMPAPGGRFRAIIVEADSHVLADIAIRDKIAKLEQQLN